MIRHELEISIALLIATLFMITMAFAQDYNGREFDELRNRQESNEYQYMLDRMKRQQEIDEIRSNQRKLQQEQEQMQYEIDRRRSLDRRQ